MEGSLIVDFGINLTFYGSIEHILCRITTSKCSVFSCKINERLK